MRRTGLLLLAAGLGACTGEMAEQDRYDPYEPAALFPNGAVGQTPVPGTVARGDPEREARLAEAPPPGAALVRRGQERYEIFCAPCHGPGGAGDGVVAGRYAPVPPSLLSARLRALPDRHVVDVITHGSGRMASYAARVPPGDRWAIAAYLRVLQEAQTAGAATDGPGR